MGHLGPTLAANGPTLVASMLHYMWPQEMVKSAEPQPSTSGYRKKQQDSQETDTKAKKGELIQNKNSDDAMVVLF